MKKVILFLLFVISPALAQVEDCTKPSCEQMGYSHFSKAQCSPAEALKCPFDYDYIFCDSGAEAPTPPVCTETCSGLNACPTNTLCSECNLTCTSGKKYTKTGCKIGWEGDDCQCKQVSVTAGEKCVEYCPNSKIACKQTASCTKVCSGRLQPESKGCFIETLKQPATWKETGCVGSPGYCYPVGRMCEAGCSCDTKTGSCVCGGSGDV